MNHIELIHSIRRGPGGEEIMRPPSSVVFYHRNCADGACSAAIFGVFRSILEKVSNQPSQFGDILYIPVNYGEENSLINDLPDILNEHGVDPGNVSDIGVVDFSFTPDNMLRICNTMKNPYVLYLDHHETSEQSMKDFGQTYANQGNTSTVIFGRKNESGASMIYSFCDYQLKQLAEYYPSVMEYMKDTGWNTDIGKIVEYCKDYDLWEHKYHLTMPFINGLTVVPISVSQIVNFLVSDKDKTQFNNFVSRGEGLILQQRYEAKRIMKNPRCKPHNIGGNKICIINLPPLWVNIVSNELLNAKFCDAVISYSVEGLSKVNISMRSLPNNPAIHCGKFMEKWFGGGGHIASSGGRCKSLGNFRKTIKAIIEVDKENSHMPFVGELL